MKPFFFKFSLFTLLIACLTIVRCSLSQSLCQPKCITIQTPPNATRCTMREQKYFMEDRSPTRGGISKPVRVDLGPGWYLFRGDKYDFIALNFSWKLPKEFPVENLGKFQILIESEQKTRKNVRPNTREFGIDGNFTTLGKVSPLFYYDCYGRFGPAIIDPGDYFNVHITPYPKHLTDEDLKRFSLSFEIAAPTCDDKSLNNVETCRNSIKILQYFCNNRTVMLQYNLSAWKGNAATVSLCQPLSSNNPRCIDVRKQPYMPLSMTAMPIEIPAGRNLNEKFFVEIYKNEANVTPLRKKINFVKACPSPESASPLPLDIILPACVIASTALITTMLCLLRHVIWKRWFNDQTCPRKGIVAAKVIGDEKNPPPSVYIIFVDDHFRHRDIVSFLVTFEMWDKEKLCRKYTLWLEKAMALADKILVIWSHGAKRRWELRTSINTQQDDLCDLFTPVMIQIKEDLFRNQNVGKYLFAYFEYCSESDIPEDFRKQSFCQFKLMDQFEELYFHLKNIENFQTEFELKQEIIAFDQLLCPNITTFGPILKNAITEMCKFVKSHPTWHCTEKSSFHPAAGNTCEDLMSDENLETAQTEASKASYISDEAARRNIDAGHCPILQVRVHRTLQPRYCLWLGSHGWESMYENRQDFDSLSEDDCHLSELKPCLEPSFEIGHDLGTISNCHCMMRFSVHSCIDSIRTDCFTEDNFKCSNETLNLEQNISETQQVYETIETCMK